MVICDFGLTRGQRELIMPGDDVLMMTPARPIGRRFGAIEAATTDRQDFNLLPNSTLRPARSAVRQHLARHSIIGSCVDSSAGTDWIR
jgi:hypothetical protein